MPIDPRDGIDDWIVPRPALLDDGYPDDWTVPGNPPGDTGPDDWTVPSSSATTSMAQPALTTQPNSPNPGISNRPGALPDLLERVSCSGPQCTQGGSYGTSGMYSVRGRTLCRDCAVKALGIQGLPAAEQTSILQAFLK
jgi:hypothetical protein